MNINDTKKILDIKGDLSSQPMGGKMDLNSNMNKSKGLGEDKAVDDKNMLNFLTNKMKEMETEFDTNEHLVLDLGNAFTKVGFSGEDLPKMLMPSIFGSLQNEKLDKKSEISFEIKYAQFNIFIIPF